MTQFMHETTLDVRFRDIDVLEHVNNAVIVTYIEQARTEFLFDMLGSETLDEMNFILAKITCDYASPVEYGETVRVQTGVRDIGQKSVTLGYRLNVEESDRHVADAETVVVFYDYEGEETIPVPDRFREAVQLDEEDHRV